MTKVLVIGLDGIAPELIFEKWNADLPNIKKLMANGVYGEHESTYPPATMVAWGAFFSGRDAGEQGIYAYDYRPTRDSFEKKLINSGSNNAKMLWSLTQKKSVVLNVPLTYPVNPINGSIVSGFLTPELDEDAVYPIELADEIEMISKGNYLFDAAGFKKYQGYDDQKLIDKVYEMSKAQYALVNHMLAKKDWDFFAHVNIGTDRMHHALWNHFDETHPRFVKNSKFKDALKDYYIYVDGEVGKILEKIDDDTLVIVASDHGMGKLLGRVNMNEWLMKEGYLVLKEEEKTKIIAQTRFKLHMVDWSKTRAYSFGNYQSRIYINKKGRDPQGIVTKEEFDSLRNELITKINAIPDSDGKKINNSVFKTEELYPNGFIDNDAPDLLVYLGDNLWAPTDEIGSGKLYSQDTTVGKTVAVHTQFGFFIISGKGVTKRGKIDRISIMDFTPTILYALGETIPKELRGVKVNI
jgi:predicted AlkP superfamily phosphohydrolase/phosphomutase